MLCALRPSWTCASIHARCGSHAEGVYGGFAFALPASRAGGRGGGISDVAPSEPVATPEGFADLTWRRIVLRSTPVRRSISRYVTPCFSSVSMAMRKCGFKTFTPGPPHVGEGVP